MDKKMTYFLEGKFIKLRHILEDDLEYIYHWYNSDKLQQTTTHHRFPNTIEKQRKYYHSMRSRIASVKKSFSSNMS